MGFLSTGRLKFYFFPRIESDTVTVRLDMPIGTPVEVTEGYVRQIAAAAEVVRDDFNSRYGEATVQNMLITVGGQPFGSRWGRGGSGRGPVRSVRGHVHMLGGHQAIQGSSRLRHDDAHGTRASATHEG